MANMSTFMSTATNTRKYLADYTILIPATWSHDPTWNTVSNPCTQYTHFKCSLELVVFIYTVVWSIDIYSLRAA